MATQADQVAAYNRMKTLLQSLRHGETPRDMAAIESFFKITLAAAREEVEWLNEDMLSIFSIAGGIFLEGDDRVQSKTFDFMLELINIFNYERSSRLNGGARSATAVFLKFYSHVVLLSSSSSSLFTKASRHAEQHVRHDHPHRKLALGAFEMCLFEEYPIHRYRKEAVKNLLKILKEKLICHGDATALTSVIIRFIDKVCENQNSCGTVILVCHVLVELIDIIASRRALPEFDKLIGSPVFRWVLCHVNRLRFKRKCWAAIARLTRAVFLSTDRLLIRALVRDEIFPTIRYMLRDGSEQVLLELLEAVNAACGDARLVPHLVSKKIMLRTLSIVERIHASRYVRIKACHVFSRFLRHACHEEVYRAAENGILAALVRLLKSRNELAVTNVLIWMRIMTDVCKHAGRGQTFQSMVIATRGDQALRRLAYQSDEPIRDAVRDLFDRLLACA